MNVKEGCRSFSELWAGWTCCPRVENAVYILNVDVNLNILTKIFFFPYFSFLKIFFSEGRGGKATMLPTETRRTLTEPRRTLTEPRRTLTEPRRTLTQPHRTLTDPRRTLLSHAAPYWATPHL
jgi:hypothetical protein